MKSMAADWDDADQHVSPDEEFALLGVDVHGWWLRFWARLELSDVHGFPAWEADVFQLLSESFAFAAASFAHYARVRHCAGWHQACNRRVHAPAHGTRAAAAS